MDGGIGEAALMGALVGGGTSLLTGSNPLTGALLGGLTGGAMNGVEGALAGSAESATKDAVIQNTLENAGVNSGVVDNGVLNSGLNAGNAFTTSGALTPGMTQFGNTATNLAGVTGTGAATAADTAQAGLTGLAGNTAADTTQAGLTGLGGMQAGQNINAIQNEFLNAGIDVSKGIPSASGLGGMSQLGANGVNSTAQQAAQQAVQDATGSSLTDQGIIANTNFMPTQNLANTSRYFGGNDLIPSSSSASNVASTAADTAAKPGLWSQAKGAWQDFRQLPKWEQAAIGVGGMYGINQLMKPPTMVDPNIGKNKYSGPALHDLSPNFKGYQATPNVYQAHYAQGGITNLATGGLDGQSPMVLGMGDNQGYPGGRLDSTQYATPTQMPTSTPVINTGYEQRTNPYTGEPIGQGFAFGGDVNSNDITAAAPSVENAAARVIGNSPINTLGSTNFAAGGISSLGGYATGGNPRLLKGPGDGMSDSIPATIGQKQPARLADGEFVVPADVVSHLGNGSTDAGAKHLYAMMDKVRSARTGNKKQGKQINPNKFLPA